MLRTVKTTYIKLLIFLLGVGCVSCTPEQRIQRIANKYNLHTQQVVTINDTFIVPQTQFVTKTVIDSNKFFYKSDTIFIAGEIVGDSIFIITTLPADTIFTEKVVEVEKFIPQKQKNNNFLRIVFLCFTWIIFLVSLCFLFRKYFKEI